MTAHIRKYFVHFVVTFSILIFTGAGCVSNNNKPDITKPPQIPPEASFIMDFNDFISTGVSLDNTLRTIQLVSLNDSEGVKNYTIGDRSNWTFAAFSVGFWNTVIGIGLAIPVASFVESFKHSPVRQDDYSWIWTYDVTVGGVIYTAKLHGKYIDNDIRWEMYISKQNEYSDFLWYYGQSNLLATEGYWVLMNKPAVPSELFRIDWHRNLVNKTGDIKYTNIIPNGPENGGFIYFEIKQPADYNRSYEIYNKGTNNKTYIEWNNVTKNGRVKDALHFNDSNWHYWDSQLLNTESQ